MRIGKRKWRLSSFQIISLSFVLLILTGTLLLMTPWATISGKSTDFLPALFTATSASCVTGLTVENTGLYWSYFGQLIILLMIQIGGLGGVTMAVAITMAAGQRIDLQQRSTIQEALAVPQLGGIVRLIRFILCFTGGVELLGACFLLPVFIPQYGIFQGLWMAVFHSISAFCNAGFDLMGSTGGGSLMGYAAHPLVNLTIMALIIAGGLGFMTWADVQLNGLNFRHYRLQTKIILFMTVGLILFPALMLFGLELSSQPLAQRFWTACFQAVTPRTAGFNTIDIESLSEAGRIVLVALMLTGGAPGSTAGGVKVTTVFTLLAATISALRMKNDVECFSRRIPLEVVRQALAIFLLYLLLFSGSTFLISVVDKVPVVDCMVETSSALGTVGLSIGLTEKLSPLSQWILIGLMYFGRVGALTMIYALNARKNSSTGRLPAEKITVG